jgi:hypothetical protein
VRESKAPTHLSTSKLYGGQVVGVTPRPRFTPGEGPPVPTGQEAGWDSELVWTRRLEEKSKASVRDQPRSSVVIHLTN